VAEVSTKMVGGSSAPAGAGCVVEADRVMNRAIIRRLTIAAVLLWSGAAFSQDGGTSRSNQEILEEAQEQIEEMEAALDEVTALQARIAADEGDLQTSQCVADAAAELQGFLALATEAQGNLATAVASGDSENITHQAGLINLSAERVQGLSQEASGCTEELLTYTGEGDADVTVDDTIPDNDDATDSSAADEQLTELLPSEPLPDATPYQ
jgi:hypothetical protein